MPQSKPHILRAALSAQGWLCWWCDMPIDSDLGLGWAPTREHLLPRRKGGRNIVSNIVAVHSACNHHRAERVGAPAESYLRHQRVNYLRQIAGIYCAKPYTENRHFDLPNFGRDPDGSPIWAPQYGIVTGSGGIAKTGHDDINRV